MKLDQRRLQELLSQLTESLNLEVKRWIDPTSPTAVAKIVKATLALRNRNGGYLVIGFDNKTLKPDLGNEPRDVRSAFHIDKIQAIVSRYASELFEIEVAFRNQDGLEYPVIVVPEGVKTPVAARQDLQEGKERLITRGDVYFRTLAANGTPSTSVARPEDWRDIVEICFDNREADLGRFLRRQLAGRDIAFLSAALSQVVPTQQPVMAPNIPLGPTLQERAEALIVNGDKGFQKALENRQPISSDEKPLINTGSWSIGLVIDPPHASRVPDHVFLTVIESTNPSYTGWPVWLSSRSFPDKRHVPKVKDKAWEGLVLSNQGWAKHRDFYRFDPKGEFYLQRALQDDLSDKVNPRTVLDPILAVIRVAESIAVGLAFAKGLDWKDDARLGFAYRWTELKGRELSPWANPLVNINGGIASDDTAMTYVEVPFDTSVSAIAPFVEQATNDLFALFDGYKLPKEAVEEWVRRLIERRL